MRSKSSSTPATVRNGIASTSRKLVTSTLHANRVMRWNVIPGARREKIVTIMFSAPKMDEKPRIVRPMIHRSWPKPGENAFAEHGTYEVHPQAGGPTRKLEYRTTPPESSSQYESAFRRGKAMSRAPSCNGMMKFANPVQTGTTKRNTIVVPCIVNAALYCCAVRTVPAGTASCVLMASASRPPERKKKNVV